MRHFPLWCRLIKNVASPPVCLHVPLLSPHSSVLTLFPISFFIAHSLCDAPADLNLTLRRFSLFVRRIRLFNFPLWEITRKPCKFGLCFPFKYLIHSVFCGFYSYIKRLLQHSMDSAFVLRKYIFVQSLFASDGYDNRILRFCFSSGINNPKWMCKLVQVSKPRYLCFIILVYLLCLEPTVIKFFGWWSVNSRTLFIRFN